jgi:hypothetical protein
MSLQQFVDGSGEIQFKEAFLSPRIVREALETRFRVVVIEETAHQLRGKIVRYARLYAAPVFWLHPTIRILISREGVCCRLSWNFRWPDYYMLLLVPVLAIFLATPTSHVMDTSLILSSGVCFVFVFLLLIFLDTKWVSWRVRRTLETLERKAP